MFISFVINGIAQNLIPGNIDRSATLQNVERNFTGFNSGQGHIENIYKIYKANSGLEVNPNFYGVFENLSNNICWRFPGGTTANFYNRYASGFGNSGIGQTFGDAWTTTSIINSIRNANYGGYSNYYTASYPNASSNVIFPFINSITNNKAANASGVFCINFLNHYRNVVFTGYDSRRETLRDTSKVQAIISLEGNYLDAFNNSTLSKDFKRIVRQNIDAFLTLINNGVTVHKVEMGNEIYAYAYDDNLISDYNTFFYNNNFLYPSDTRVWLKDDGSAQSIKNTYTTLWTYARLAKLYRVLLTDTLQKLSSSSTARNNFIYEDHLRNVKFGVPISAKQDGGFKRWNDFMLQPEVKSYIGNDAYIVHPYFDSTNYFKNLILSPLTNNSTDVLEDEFKAIRDTMEISYNNRFFKSSQVNLINSFPEGSELWYTEWNFNFDNNNLKKVGNTLLHAMYYYDVIMNFFDLNANKNLAVTCNKINPVQLCNYQIPYAKEATWYNMTRFINGYGAKASDPLSTTNSEANSVEYHSPYYAHLLLSPILEDPALQYIDNSNGGFNNIRFCSFRSFTKKECSSGCCRDVVYVYFDNKSDSDYEIDLKTALDIGNLNCVEVTKNSIYANNLFASMGQTTFRMDDLLYADTQNGADITIQRAFNEDVDDTLLDHLKISKYSLGYFKVMITIPTPDCACNRTAARKGKTNSDADSRKSPEPEVTQKPAEFKNTAARIYPNPSLGNVTIEIQSLKNLQVQINIFDMAGNLARSFSKELNEGENQIPIELGDLPKSAYLIRVDGENIQFAEKLILQ